MNITARLVRDDTITDALRAADKAIGNEPPTDQALRILAALKAMLADQPTRVVAGKRIDYLRMVQDQAQVAWHQEHGQGGALTGIEHDAAASVTTPIGRLRAIVWRRQWNGSRGTRLAWASEYWLDEEPITIAEIRASGLAQRPSTRNRTKKSVSE